MIGFLKEKILKRRLRARLRKACQMRPEFLLACKTAFIQKLGQENPTSELVLRRRFSFGNVFKYGLASFSALIFLSSGAIVYADKTNVNSSSPLYTLKRVGENVRLTLAPTAQTSVLHTEFARRRLEEIKVIKVEQADLIAQTDLKVQAPAEAQTKMAAQKQKITNLRNQLRQEVNSVITQIEQKQIEKTSAQKLCNSVSLIMKEDDANNQEETNEARQNVWAGFNKNCGDLLPATQ